MSNHFLEDWILFYSSWKHLKAADVFVLDFCEKMLKRLKRDKKGIKKVIWILHKGVDGG